MLSKKRRRVDPPTSHRLTNYTTDFPHLASLYPSFLPFLSPTFDFADPNALRELARLLLLHHHNLHWSIPDGQLCPAVPNRANYVHWVGDLVGCGVVRGWEGDGTVRGFDIGTGASCIYPLLGAAVYGWSFVGSDVTEVALEWAKKNVESNPHLSHLIEIRDASEKVESGEAVLSSDCAFGGEGIGYHGPPILLGVVKDDEKFDFCMCNPPFFERMEEASLNPKTAFSGTPAEMVCPGGERAFISRIIEDSASLKHSFRWFTSMVGRKTNLKFLVSKLRRIGVSIVKTTEFVQGQTARWGLAWSFVTPDKKSVLSKAPPKSHFSFMIEGLHRKSGASNVLKAVESFFLAYGAICKCDMSSFNLNITIATEKVECMMEGNSINQINDDGSNNMQRPLDELPFCISVFEQIPGTILVKGSLSPKEVRFSAMFSSLFHNMEESLKEEFGRKTGRR